MKERNDRVLFRVQNLAAYKNFREVFCSRVPTNLAAVMRSYLSGFNGSFESEAIHGALPVGQNNPQKCPFGLYAVSTAAKDLIFFQEPRVYMHLPLYD